MNQKKLSAVKCIAGFICYGLMLSGVYWLAPLIAGMFGYTRRIKPVPYMLLLSGMYFTVALFGRIQRKWKTEPTTAAAASSISTVNSASIPAKAPQQNSMTQKKQGQAQGKAAEQKVENAKGREKRITFADIAGYDATKRSMAFIVSCLKNRSALSAIGSSVPSGMLLYGPPGTGKTMMAAAVAGSAGVPFFSVNASVFINRYVGSGPAAIRSLYEKARAAAPSVVFIDEIDAVGGVRAGGENEEYRSTINALLSELDGINGSAGVLTIAATNRLSDLDPALVRPGRFDRKISIPLPGYDDRLAILNICCKNRPMDEFVDLEQLAMDMEGMAGAGISTVINEAGIIAVSAGRTKITTEDIDTAMFRAATGGEEMYNPDEKIQTVTAWHEAGHALCLKLLCDRNVSRITIIGSTAGTNGITCNTAKSDCTMISKRMMENYIKAAYGGRAAEEIYFNGSVDDITTSSVGDIAQATAMIKDYLTTYGMGNTGLINTAVLSGTSNSDAYLTEANALADRLYKESLAFLKENRELLEAVVKVLLRKKTITDDELTVLVYKTVG